MAGALGVGVVIHSGNGLVADIAEHFFALVASKGIAPSLLLVDCMASWTFCTELEVDIIIATNELLLHLSSNLFWLKNSIETSALRIFFEVLLAFSNIEAGPTEPSMTSRALNMSTLSATLHQGVVLAALKVRTLFSTVFKVDCSKSLL